MYEVSKNFSKEKQLVTLIHTTKIDQHAAHLMVPYHLNLETHKKKLNTEIDVEYEHIMEIHLQMS